MARNLTEINSYLFDINGFVVIYDALSKDQVNLFNSILDQQYLPPPTTYNRFGTAPLGSGFLGWNEVFLTLLDSEQVYPMVQSSVGLNPQLVSVFGIYEEPYLPNNDIKQSGAQIKPEDNDLLKSDEHEMCTVAWNLTDTGPGIGGFACMAGSHRQADVGPPDLGSDEAILNHATIPDAPAGSAIILSQRLLQCSASWFGPHQRRTLTLTYRSRTESMDRVKIDAPESTKLNQTQQALFNQ